MVLPKESLRIGWPLQDANNRIDDIVKCRGVELAGFGLHQGTVGGEKLGRPCIAYPLQRTCFEITISNLDGCRIGIWIAGYLTKDPVISTSRGKHHCGTKLGR
ncbi:MAG: hypothetical protein V3S16_05045 [Candidatus Desulfatibia sp.]